MGRPEAIRPLRPRGRRIAVERRSCQHLELMDLGGALPMTRPHTIRAGVPTPDHRDSFPPRPDCRTVVDNIARHSAVLLREEVHRQMNAAELATGNAQIARRLRAT